MSGSESEAPIRRIGMQEMVGSKKRLVMNGETQVRPIAHAREASDVPTLLRVASKAVWRARWSARNNAVRTLLARARRELGHRFTLRVKQGRTWTLYADGKPAMYLTVHPVHNIEDFDRCLDVWVDPDLIDVERLFE